MKIGVSGWRHYHNYGRVKEVLDGYDISDIVVGDATGADSLARRYCREVLGKEPIVKYADWDKYAGEAGPIRNREIIREGIELLVAFPSRSSRGTVNMINLCQWEGIQVDIYPV